MYIRVCVCCLFTERASRTTSAGCRRRLFDSTCQRHIRHCNLFQVAVGVLIPAPAPTPIAIGLTFIALSHTIHVLATFSVTWSPASLFLVRSLAFANHFSCNVCLQIMQAISCTFKQPDTHTPTCMHVYTSTLRHTNIHIPNACMCESSVIFIKWIVWNCCSYFAYPSNKYRLQCRCVLAYYRYYSLCMAQIR